MIQKSKGFTLIELISVIVLLGIISTIVGQILLNSYRTFLVSKKISETDWQGMLALARLTNEIHTIRSANDISTIESTQLSFTNSSGSTVQYQWSGHILLRNSQPLIGGIQGLSFTYLDRNGAVTSTAISVRYIIISVTILEDGMEQSFLTMVATRGMM